MKSFMTRLFVLAVGLCLALTTSSTYAQQGETPLRPGEQLKITLTGAPPNDMQSMASMAYPIGNSGTISLQYLKSEVRAAGLTPSELARQLVATYKNAGIYTNPTFNVSRLVDITTSEVVTVSGEVRVGGSVVLRPGMRIMDAISDKGGFGDFGNPGRVRLVRGQNTQELDLRDVSKHPSNNVILKAGDLIIVPKAGLFGR